MKETSPEPNATSPSPTIEYKRGEDFIDRYANNVMFQPSAWDLKLLFGSLDQSIGPNHITQHTGIALSWAQVKLLNFIISLQLIAHESRMGRVQVVPGAIPPIPTDVEDVTALLGTFTNDRQAYAKALKLYEDFIANNPEALPREQDDLKTGQKQ